MTELTKEGSAIRVAYETVDENMAGAMSMVIMVDTHTSDGLYNPRLLQAMDNCRAALRPAIRSGYPHQFTSQYC